MGFYGQVVYEFKKLFSSLKITSAHTSETAIEPPASSDKRVQALQPWDELNISPANRWIQLNTDPTTKTITIGHSTPGAEDTSKKVIGFSRVEEDEVGDATVIPLDYGDYIKTTISNYDSAGHSIGSEISYFQMPAGELVEGVTELQEDRDYIFENFVNTLEEEGKGIYIENYLQEHEYVNTENLNDAMQDYLNEKGYVTVALTGTGYDLYPNKAEYPAITEAIGPVTGDDGFSKAIARLKGVNEDTEYTVSQGISETAQRIKNLEDTIYNLQSQVRSLSEKIDELTT